MRSSLLGPSFPDVPHRDRADGICCFGHPGHSPDIERRICRTAGQQLHTLRFPRIGAVARQIGRHGTRSCATRKAWNLARFQSKAIARRSSPRHGPDCRPGKGFRPGALPFDRLAGGPCGQTGSRTIFGIAFASYTEGAAPHSLFIHPDLCSWGRSKIARPALLRMALTPCEPLDSSSSPPPSMASAGSGASGTAGVFHGGERTSRLVVRGSGLTTMGRHCRSRPWPCLHLRSGVEADIAGICSWSCGASAASPLVDVSVSAAAGSTSSMIQVSTASWASLPCSQRTTTADDLTPHDKDLCTTRDGQVAGFAQPISEPSRLERRLTWESRRSGIFEVPCPVKGRRLPPVRLRPPMCRPPVD